MKINITTEISAGIVDETPQNVMKLISVAWYYTDEV